MKFISAVAAVAILPLTVRSEGCGPENGSIAIAGSSTVLPVAQKWAESYADLCDTVTVTAEGGGSSAGAARVCANEEKGMPVDIGDMSRGWKDTEATLAADGYTYQCLKGDPTRSAVQIDVAIDGLSVVTKADGAGAACIEKLGGLTLDQLRWIFSSYTDDQLAASGWDAASIANSDSESATHFWSELHPDCADVEIKIAGPDDQSGTYEYFLETILIDHENGETFAVDGVTGYFNSAVDEDIIGFLEEHADAIGFFGYAYYAENNDVLYAAPIENSSGNFIAPTPESVGDGTYNPLARRIFMNLLVDDETLKDTIPFIEHGFSDVGLAGVAETGYVAIPAEDITTMLGRLESAMKDATCGPEGGSFTIAGSSTVLPVAEAWAEMYQAYCSTTITAEGGGSSAGAARVCANLEKGTPVDIGDMSRGWKDTEATLAADGYTYQCLKGDTSRSAVQVDVAIDGLSVVTRLDGAASNCIEKLGGLTTDQLRWIFSNYAEEQLTNSGWDSASVANSDGDDSTYKWSELDSRCTDKDIVLAGPDDQSGTYEYFLETILTDFDNGETFRAPYENSAVDEEVAEVVAKNGVAIAYFGYAYYVENIESLSAAAIQNAENNFVAPDSESVANGTYNPLARRIFMNLLVDEEVLEHTIPFLEYGFSDEGSAAVAGTGYVVIPEEEKDEMITRVYTALESAGAPPFEITGITSPNGEPQG